jgi:RsiW-degrading membrane proteinase PrsW (M82 family)
VRALAFATALAPVVTFLAALVYLDSYKLVRLRAVLAMLAAGIAAAAIAYVANDALAGMLHLEFRAYSRYAAPVVEEALKGLLVVALIRAHRIGFLVDAAILGFSAGAGFALAENVHYLGAFADPGPATWLVRGFGTAIMHGGVSAIFAVLGLALVERDPRAGARAFVPGFALAVVLHSAFNHVLHLPLVAAAGIALVLPPLFLAVFERSERAVGDWLGRGFDADARMLELINSGGLADSPVGRYLQALTGRFKGPVVADILCYVRLHTEQALRAKGILMMRENGFDAPVDAATRAKFDEIRYLEGSIGRTGLIAVQPLLHMSHRDLWQFYMLGKG